MNTFNITEIKPGTYFTNDVIIDKTFLLFPSTVPITNEMIKALADWDFRQIYSDGTIATGAVTVESVAISEADIMKLSDTENLENSDISNSTQKNQKATLGDAVKRALVTAEEENSDAELSRLSVVQTVYNEYLNYISAVYTRYATHKELNLEDLSSTVKDLCVYIKENRRYVLRVQPTVESRSRDFLVNHSMRSTVLAITIGLQLRLPLSKLIELGVSCILHEIGMIRLPPQLYMTDRPLTSADKKTMCTHPVLAYNILKSYDFPLSICLGVLEHHERENGSGYPRHMTAEKISMYAKIISVACSFEAITAARHYKEAQSSYEAMVEMLKNNRQQYDESVIKALLYSLSLFPIGGYVFLSDGKVALVTDVNPENPKNPIVQVLMETDENGEPKIIQTSDTGVRIIRALSRDETEDIKKAQAELQKNEKQEE